VCWGGGGGGGDRRTDMTAVIVAFRKFCDTRRETEGRNMYVTSIPLLSHIVRHMQIGALHIIMYCGSVA